MTENDRNQQTLTSTQQRAISALMSESSIQAAARSCGISERTMRRWLKRTDFVAVFTETRREVMRIATARLQAAAGAAVDALLEVVRDRSTPPGARASASRIILDATVRLVELEDLAERLAELERAVCTQETPRTRSRA